MFKRVLAPFGPENSGAGDFGYIGGNGLQDDSRLAHRQGESAEGIAMPADQA